VSQWLLPATAAPTTRPIHVSRGHKDAGPGVHFVSPGLLQLTVLWHRLAEGLMRRLQELHWLPVRHWVDFKMATRVYLSVAGLQPIGRRLPVGLRRRSSSAAFCHIEDVRCEANLQQLWRQVFCSCRSEAVEQPSSN